MLELENATGYICLCSKYAKLLPEAEQIAKAKGFI